VSLTCTDSSCFDKLGSIATVVASSSNNGTRLSMEECVDEDEEQQPGEKTVAEVCGIAMSIAAIRILKNAYHYSPAFINSISH
jgi:hypothetical protein